jgi:hypothetical protein
MKLYKTPNRHLAITPGGLTKSIDRLEAARLVRRAPDPDDGRGTPARKAVESASALGVRWERVL